MASFTIKLIAMMMIMVVNVCLAFPNRFLMGRPPRTPRPHPKTGHTPSPSPEAESTYGVVLAGPFIKLDSRVPISSCPQFTTEYLQVLTTPKKHLRIPHSRILTNGQRCGKLLDNATEETLMYDDDYTELIPIDHLLTRDTADEHGVLGAYKKLVSKRPYTYRFFQYLLQERLQAPGGPSPSYIGYERYSTRKCGDVELGIQSIIFFGVVNDLPVNLTGLLPRLEQTGVHRDVRLTPGREFHVTFTPNGSLPEHVCPSVLRRRIIVPIPDVRKCFPAGMMVQSARGVIDVSDVRIGDRLFDGEGYSEVVLLTHQDDETISSFIELTLEDGFAITLSEGHYLYTGRLLRAGEITPGTKLRTQEGLKEVLKVGVVRSKGLYNMQTASGKVVVGGVVASCYTTAVRPFVAHGLLAPVRFGFGTLRRVKDMLRGLRVDERRVGFGYFGMRVLMTGLS